MDLDLHRSSDDLPRLINRLHLGFFTLDHQGIFVSWSDGASKITGLPSAEVVGQPHALLDTDDPLRLEALWRRILEGEDFANAVVTLRHREGHELYLLADLRRLEENGALAGAVGALTDLTLHTQVNHRQSVLRQPERNRRVFQRMVGESPLMQDVFQRIEQAAGVEVTVLIRGETGTGKELVAQAIHALSDRKDKPLICVNCSAIPDPLLESELFGHVKGAFTGAIKDKRGVFEAANGGTLFLDEIGDLGLPVQVKLLRALQEREIRRVGDDRVVKVDVRIISATHRNLAAMVAAREFREDLYYRLRVFELMMPPLRQRAGDLPLLIAHLVEDFNDKHRREVEGVAPEAMESLERYPWPGNIRELRNALEHAFVTVQEGRIALKDLPEEIRGRLGAAEVSPMAAHVSRLPRGKVDPTEERARIVAALRQAAGKKSLAASMLGMSRVTLWKKIKRHGINPIYEG